MTAIGRRIDCTKLSMRDLRRLVHEMWGDPRCGAVAGPAVAAAAARGARSLDRAMIMAYLHHFPVRSPAFSQLRAAVSRGAARHDWVWRERGSQWRLWDDQAGPEMMARKLLLEPVPVIDLLQDAGLDGDLMAGGFVARIMAAACQQAEKATTRQAPHLGERLMAAFAQVPVGTLDAALVRALLTPWRQTMPGDAYRQQLCAFLTTCFDDPRLQTQRWGLLAEAMGDEGAALLKLVRRWFTDASMRMFFDLVDATVDNRVQWAERRSFWMAYLDAGLIDDAWFALGRVAESRLGGTGQEMVGYGRIEGERQYADPAQSALIISIGGLRMAEWSDNGACRFWREDDRQAPAPMQVRYWGYQLRAMNGGSGFEYLRHASSWQYRFAQKIHQETGIAHPQFGRGI